MSAPRYRAVVTFPAGALEVDEINALMHAVDMGDDAAEGRDVFGWELETILGEDTVVAVADPDARYGDMDEITDLLNEHCIPYDHQHCEAGEVGTQPGTDHVRYEGVKRSVVWINETIQEKLSFAQELLMSLDEDLDGKQDRLAPRVTGMLRGLIAKHEFVPIHDIEWSPPAP